MMNLKNSGINDSNIDEVCKELDKVLATKGLTRREALKIAGISGAAFAFNPSEAEAATSLKASTAKGKIVIVGGGAAGVSTASLILNKLDNADVTVIEPHTQSVSYQPGQTLIAAGVWDGDATLGNTEDFMPSGAKWIKDEVTDIDGDNNKVTTSKNGDISYDYLIVAAGLQLDYGKIKGLESIGSLKSMEESAAAAKLFGKSTGVNSIYFLEGSKATWDSMQEFVSRAKNEKVKGVFTHPNTPIKCGGAPKKIMYLTDARLREAGNRNNADLTFYPNGGKMFGVPEYHEAIVNQFKEREMKWNYKHNLVEVDVANKKAVFEHAYKVKGAWDEDLEEYEEITKKDRVEVEYDFLHITPPMSAPTSIAKSSVGSAKGWIPVNKETLQHVKYENVFALGDIAAVPMGKTGGSVRKQYKVLVDNLISKMEKKTLNAKYGGYTVCPLITSIGTVMLAEFDWSKKPTPMVPLDPTQERWIWWILKVYMLKPMYFYGMLSGRA